MRTWAVWAIVGSLALIGVGYAVQRAGDVITGPHAGGLSPTDQRSFDQLAVVLGMKQGSSEYTQMRSQVVQASEKYHVYPATALLHVLPGALILLMGLAQFSPWIRAHHIAFHRISGRILLAAIVAAGLSGLFFGLVVPYGGLLESTAAATFGGYMLLAAARAFYFIRRRDIIHHREWMIRMFSVAIGIALMRVMSIVAVLAFKAGADVLNPRAMGAMLWIGWLASVCAAEVWIRRTRPSR